MCISASSKIPQQMVASLKSVLKIHDADCSSTESGICCRVGKAGGTMGTWKR